MCVTPLFFFLWGGKKQLTTGTLAGAIYTYRSLFWVTTPFALVALLSEVTRALPALPSCCHLETDCAHVAVNMLPRQLQQESIYWQHSVRLT